MKIKDLQIQLQDAVGFIDALQTNVQNIAREDERDANLATDGSNKILSGRAELAYQIDEMIQYWKEESFK
jgi:hypothetical protein